MGQPLLRDPFVAPEIFSSFPTLVASQSTRHGGESPAPFDSLNLGLSTGDAHDYVHRNREVFFGEQEIDISQVALSHQVHSDAVLYAKSPGKYDGFDALITNKRHVFLAVSIADCVPILIYDYAAQAVAAVHAGWRGTSKQILYKTLRTLQATFGTTANTCVAYIGTCISAAHYQVDADVAAHFNSDVKVYSAPEDKFYLDLKLANVAQLKSFGLSDDQIEVSPYCTYADSAHFFSHRFATHHTGGKTGRMMACIGLR
jgi:YfiH family protein